ncbi:Ig-like domain-containing protein [Pontibacter aquaedesilientis]|uniref:Ig-like domain-containing protein n=1 Tax=Pontibacter aquaedesilientis TaxID=2766980 RepID=UPI001CD15FD4|nr:T9SS type A sorting domain-containing protein [Pontibacter aquaedesilientis]
MELKLSASAPTSVTSTPLCGQASITAAGAGTGQSYRWYTVATGGTAIAGVTGATYTTSTPGDYYVSIVNNGTDCTTESARRAVTATTNPIPAAPTVTNASRCGPGSMTMTASGAGTGQSYRWYTVASGGAAIAGATGATYTTSTPGNYYVSIVNDGTSCESTRTMVTATVNAIPAAPTVTNASRCGAGSMTMAASGAGTGQSYRWYTIASGGAAIAGATGANYTTSTPGTYYVSIVSDAGCESGRSAVTATVNAIPAAPTVTNATVSRCGEGEMTLTASGAESGQIYRWYNPSGDVIIGQTANTYITSTAGNYAVSLVNSATNCESVKTAVTAKIKELVDLTGGNITISTDQPNNKLEVGQPARFEAMSEIIDKSDADTYFWQFTYDGMTWEGAPGASTTSPIYTNSSMPAGFRGVRVDIRPRQENVCYSNLSASGVHMISNMQIAPLPVELVSFKAQPHAQGVNLTWVTASELGNKGFEVQVSTNSKNFTTVGFVESKVGTTSIKQNYSFLDTKAAAGTRYYRLKQIDLDGKSEYSAIKAVVLGGGTGTVTAYPNPFEDVVVVKLNGSETRKVSLLLTNSIGKTVLAKEEEAAGNTVTLDTSSLTAKGVYILHVVDNGSQHAFKLIKR